jgi:N-acetylmuramoyl-L-alanine amidase
VEEQLKSQVENTLFKLGFLKNKNVGYEELTTALLGFQQVRGLTVNGELDSQTLKVLDEAHWSLGDRVLKLVPNSLMRGDDIAALQSKLVEMGFNIGRVDGIYGARTESGVKDFQLSVGVKSDGTCGPATVIALMRLVKVVSGGLPHQLRDEINRVQSGPSLLNKIIVLDPQTQSKELFDVAQRLEGRLNALGVSAILTRNSNTVPDELTRIEIANSANADLVISFALDTFKSDKSTGFAVYYYGNDSHGAHSVVGEKFANLVEREIAARTDLINAHSHPKTWNFLRLTKSPTVQINLGYQHNPIDLQKLSNPEFREALVEAVLISIQRLYLTVENDAKTGTLKVEDLRRLGLRK